LKPKIVTNSISLLSPLTGVGRYTYEISDYIERSGVFESHYFYGYFSKRLLSPDNGKDIKTVTSFIIGIPFLKKIARKSMWLSSRLSAPQFDIYWQPNFIPIDGIKAKKVVTSVHDFSFILHRDFQPKERIEYFEKKFFKNITKSDIIITGSEYSKQEILDRLNFNEKQVRVIYHGVRHDIFKVYDNLDLPFELPQKFIFSVGSIEPRKNLIGLLKSYNSLSDHLKSEYQLVLAGFKGWENREIMDLIEQNRENIHYLGYISDEELAKVYNLASLFVYPSFYEGFGLPVLEAMACGTPVLCSNVTSLPEVGGDAVVYCDPSHSEDIQDKITLVVTDEELQKSMRQKGILRAKQFTWEKSAREHIRVFKEVMEER